MSVAKVKKTTCKKSPYVTPEIVDYGDGREATKGAPGTGGALDAGLTYLS
jgi:hypothetical protein